MDSTNLSRYDNSWYQPGPAWKRMLWFIVGHALVNSYLPLPVSVRVAVLRLFGARIGQGVMIKPKVNIKYPWFLEISDFAWIGEEVWIDNLVPVRIGPHACLSQGAMLLTGNHDYKKSTFDLRVGEITLEAGVWIGAKAVVCPGVRAHSHAVLAVNSVATQSLDAYSIYQGNPAVRVRDRTISGPA
jgi:putative colanic acid biosynthesis acetyltransferase WcaF